MAESVADSLRVYGRVAKSLETTRTFTQENIKKLHGLGSVSAGLHAYRITAVAAR